jgi:hypothetical protein
MFRCIHRRLIEGENAVQNRARLAHRERRMYISVSNASGEKRTQGDESLLIKFTIYHSERTNIFSKPTLLAIKDLIGQETPSSRLLPLSDSNIS